MKAFHIIAASALALSSAWAAAQDAPESLLPPGFDEQRPPAPVPRSSPAPRPAVVRPVPARAPVASPSPASAADPRPVASSSPVVQPLPANGETPGPVVARNEAVRAPWQPGQPLPPIEVLERLSPAELDTVLGLKAQYDIPPGARRSADNAGIIDESEGGLGEGLLLGQDASLVRAAIAGNDGLLVSRWGHMLLRRALVSRMAPPPGMSPADFAALRAGLLVRMGEGEAARAMVQDIDTGEYSPALTAAALDAYVATADFTGICPAMATQGPTRDDPRWQVARTICNAFQGGGGGGGAMARLDRASGRRLMPRIDMLLAQKYAGAAGSGRRAVTIEWDGVTDMTPWRFALATAVGLTPPERLMRDAGPRYAYVAATAPMLGLATRAAAADRAGGAGVLSSAAMVDLYSQMYADADVTGDWSVRAGQLHDAYGAPEAAARLAAMAALWDGVDDPLSRYAREVLTAYAAARLPVSRALSGDRLATIIASMLSAGLDANAIRWTALAPASSEAWALLAVANPDGTTFDRGAVRGFVDGDGSPKQRKSAFLVAGLAGLGRLSIENANDLAGDLGVDLAGQTRWTRMIDRAAQVDNPELVALLAGVGMQGDGWDKMTPRFLFHIVAALRQAGMEPEARMIAAEAVARG